MPDYIASAIDIAHRSGIKRYKTGCVIVNRGIAAWGWSHYSEIRLKKTYSLHAELHAIFNAYRPDLCGATAYVATIAAKSGRPTMSKPCDVCLPALKKVGIVKVVYTLSADGELVTNTIDL